MTKKNIVILTIHLAVSALIILLPVMMNHVFSIENAGVHVSLNISLAFMVPVITIYLVNFYSLVPYLFYRKKRFWFYLANLFLVQSVNWGWYFYDPSNLPTDYRAGYFSYIIMVLVLDILAAGCALGIRHLMRLNEIQILIKEEKQRNAEAELAWLKSQINPHFLFNTLNNISSLTQIDANAAQDGIARLSDLLRYAMYETNKERVPLKGEVEFMNNYIELMKLRCNEKTRVCTSFRTEDGGNIAPLLFISLVENAFKHGVSASRPSQISIRLTTQGEKVTFECANTNYPKKDTDRSGSGIGIENTRRRLELLYPARHTYEQTVTDGIYQVKITLL